MCSGVLSACLYVHYVHAWCLWRSEEGIGSPGTGIMDGCETLYGYWGSDQDPRSNKCCQTPSLLSSLHMHFN